MVRIGDFEFVAHPGYVGMRKLSRPFWKSLIYMASPALLAVHEWSRHKSLLGFWIALLYLSTMTIHFIVEWKAASTKPLVEWRDGRLYIRSEDAGSADDISIAVNAEKRRFVVLAQWPGQPRRPHLIWWTRNEEDASQLRDLIATAIPSESGVWPPPPTLPVES